MTLPSAKNPVSGAIAPLIAVPRPRMTVAPPAACALNFATSFSAASKRVLRSTSPFSFRMLSTFSRTFSSFATAYASRSCSVSFAPPSGAGSERSLP